VQLFNATGTIAPTSFCRWREFRFYATHEGIFAFNGVSTETLLVDVIKDIWYPQSATSAAKGLQCAVAGDTLFVYATMYDALTGSSGTRMLAVDLNTKNISQWTMAMGVSTLQADAILDPSFTTMKSGVITPEFWLADDEMIYRYSWTYPTSAAEQLTYYYPCTDMGNPTYEKYPSVVYIMGKGGTCRIYPVLENAVSALYWDVELPATIPAQVATMVAGISGVLIGWKIMNVGGDPIEVKDFTVQFERSRFM
jgi:hypothetical protein